MTHFLQSEAWESFQQSLGRKSVVATGDTWSYRAFLESGTLNTRLYTPYGPTCDNTESLKTALAHLIGEGKKYNATFVRVEPITSVTREVIQAFNLKPVTYQHLQPTDTQIIDLSPTADELLAAMSQNTRNIVRNYHKKGVSIHVSKDPSDISILLELLKKVAARTGMRPQSDVYLTKQAEILISREMACIYYASYENQPIAAALFYQNGTTRYYAHAAADDEFRKLQPGTALLGRAILDAKNDGFSFVDLYGIAPKDAPATHPWAGFTRFKQSFGGSPISYGGAWDLPLKPLRYKLYRTYQALYRRLR